jgi:glycosyltransferase involved in cell wall biosynthesis
LKHAIVSVTNDLVTDQRVDRVCSTLVGLGFEVLLAGREKASSPPLPERIYKMHRMKLLFEKGFLFYAEYNMRLFLFLLFRKPGLLIANDLDTLLPNFLIHKLKGIPLVYDSHELFTETPEVIYRPFVKSVWESIEKWIFPKLQDIFTVSEPIAEIFRGKYKVKVRVVRNVPVTKTLGQIKSRQDLNLPANLKILIMQGSGINIQRGAEELVLAMKKLTGYLLLIIGDGDVISELKSMVKELDLEKSVWFYPRMPVTELQHFTQNADLGLTIDKDTNLNYRYSLPNKLFDYIHAGIPVLASPLEEVRKIVEKYDIGLVTENHEPVHIAGQIILAMSDEERIRKWKENCKFAARELCWEKEEEVIKEVYQKYV